MRKLLVALVGLVLLYSCEKVNPSDNSPTIIVPYALYASEQEGNIWKTNDAVVYELWSGGGSAFSNEFFLADTNFVQVRQKLYVWNGIRNPKYPKIVPGVAPLTNINPEKPAQMNIAIHDPKNTSLWVCVNPTPFVSKDNGATWTQYTSPPPVVAMGAITSLAQTKNGNVYAMNVSNKVFENIGGLTTTAFTAKTTTGIPTGTGSDWALANKGDTLFMIDETGNSQAYYSTDSGKSFKVTSGLPAKKRINMAKQLSINGNFYIGTDSAGLYKLNGTTFQRTGLGLPAHARIWDIVHKRNTYLTGVTKDYLFLATDMGLFMSENNDTDWVLVRQGQFVNVL